MTNVVEFPGAEPVEKEWTQDKIDEVHGRAFRDLEKSISDCRKPIPNQTLGAGRFDQKGTPAHLGGFFVFATKKPRAMPGLLSC